MSGMRRVPALPTSIDPRYAIAMSPTRNGIMSNSLGLFLVAYMRVHICGPMSAPSGVMRNIVIHVIQTPSPSRR